MEEKDEYVWRPVMGQNGRRYVWMWKMGKTEE